MDIHDSGDAVDVALAGLRAYDADPGRVERIRARCLSRLAARRGYAGGPHPGVVRRWIEPAAAFGLGAIYLVAAFGSSLALLR